jgi:hypothetical protein
MSWQGKQNVLGIQLDLSYLFEPLSEKDKEDLQNDMFETAWPASIQALCACDVRCLCSATPDTLPAREGAPGSARGPSEGCEGHEGGAAPVFSGSHTRRKCMGGPRSFRPLFIAFLPAVPVSPFPFCKAGCP